MQESMRLMQRFGSPPNGDHGAREQRSAHRADPPAGSGFLRALKAVTAALADRYAAVFAVDPALFVAVPPETPDADLPIEQALEVLVTPLAGAVWRRIHLPEAQIRELRRAHVVEKLATAVRTLEGLECGDMVLEDAEKRRNTLYRRHAAAAEGEPAEPGTRPVYLLYSTAPAARGHTLGERFADLQRQQMALMLQMGPDAMAGAMAHLLQAYEAADSATRTRLLGLPVTAGLMAVWFPREAKERQEAGGDSR
jgi:hypothetical protein